VLSINETRNATLEMSDSKSVKDAKTMSIPTQENEDDQMYFQVDGMGNENSIEECLDYTKFWKISIHTRDVNYRLRPKNISKKDRWNQSSEFKLRQISKKYRECKDSNKMFFVDQAIDGSAYLYDTYCRELHCGRWDYKCDDGKEWYVVWKVLGEFLRLEGNNITPDLKKRIRDFRDKKVDTLSANTIDEMIMVDRIRAVYNRNEVLCKFSKTKEWYKNGKLHREVPPSECIRNDLSAIKH
jgi:hypothetical protein